MYLRYQEEELDYLIVFEKKRKESAVNNLSSVFAGLCQKDYEKDYQNYIKEIRKETNKNRNRNAKPDSPSKRVR